MGAKEFNIFVSYAWADNQPFEAGAQGWVSTFVDRLRKLLGRELQREYASDEVWLDYEQLRGSDSITRGIRNKLEASRILMPIVSRGYLDSRWCTQEREIFLGLHGPEAGRIVPHPAFPCRKCTPSPAVMTVPVTASAVSSRGWHEPYRPLPRPASLRA